MSKLCVVQISKIDYAVGGMEDPVIYTVKPKAAEQLAAYLKQLEQDGLAMKCDDSDIT